ncbi:hypothetical protein [Actinomadura mexicana]|uniref:Uncharacterized protein n=1 Tax=Actinomadura mexicana TaxID=134959 RepID=A0A238XE37_9ACTN|nr:hypothetical protein [Actinomadura mexicana]SNR56851.1 hypothetical protein SAMN06265355_104221 [Actinomadura mexicana]
MNRETQGDLRSRRPGKIYYLLVILFAAVFVGLGTVVGSALIPSAWPRDPLGIFAAIVAVLIFTATAAITIVIPGDIDDIARSLANRPLKELGKKAVLERQRRVLVAVTTLLAIIVVTAWQLNLSVIIAPSKNANLGGLDLEHYCRNYGFNGNEKEGEKFFCSTEIGATQKNSARLSLNGACIWDKGQQSTFKLRSPNNPYSGECYNANHTPIGGVGNMSGYCEHVFKGMSKIQATVADAKWVCRSAIDMKLACAWSYQELDVEARMDVNTDQWNCYK